MWNGKKLFFCDAESFSAAPLVKSRPLNGHDASCGPWVYAEDPTTEILMWSYCTGVDGAPALWDATNPDTPDMPDEMREGLLACERGDMYAAWWNGNQFDRLLVKELHGINIPVEHCIDLMLLARQACLPAGLSGCCAALNIPEDQCKQPGKALIQFFCKPYYSRKGGVKTLSRRTRDTHPEKWAEFCSYGFYDTVAMVAIWKRMPKINWNGPRGDFERRLIAADSAINDRGVRIDTRLAKVTLDTLANSKQDLSASTEAEHGVNLASNDQFLQTLAAAWPQRHIQISGKGAAAKGTLLEYLRDPDIPDAASALIYDRMELTSKGGGKFQQILCGTSADGRYRGGYEYGRAARTLRWGGSRAGFMNMSRGYYHDGDEGQWSWDEKELTRGISMLHKGTAHLRYDINKLAASVTRSTLLPDEGEELHVSDFSNIEGRLAFYLSGGIHGVQKFIDQDKGGPGVYELAAAGMFGIPVSEVTKDQRQIGKLVSLSSQYQSAVAGFVQFAKGYNFNVLAMCERLTGTLPREYWNRSASSYEFALLTRQNMGGLIKKHWRIVWCLIQMWRDNAERDCGLVSMWNKLNEAAINAVVNPGRKFWAGARVRADGKRAFSFTVPCNSKGDPKPWLFMELPSERVIMFASPEVRRKKKVDDPDDVYTGKLELMFKGPDEDTGVWTTQRLYGGKVMAIGTQSTARDFQGEAIVRVHEAGERIVIHVHDEIGTTVKPGHTYDLRGQMCIVPDWFAQDFPLTGSFDIMQLYRK